MVATPSLKIKYQIKVLELGEEIMPSAVVILNETQTFDLKSLPEGKVTLRRMTYGEHLKRQSMMTMSLVNDLGSNKKSDMKASVEMAQEQQTLFEFSKCVVEHNLEDTDGRRLNLGANSDLMKLDPRVGQEIANYIKEMNDLETEDDTNPLGL